MATAHPNALAGRRKDEHLRIAARADVDRGGAQGLDAIALRHRALPERALQDVSLKTELLGTQLAAPLMVSAMTGGTDEAGRINARLIAAAAEHGIGLVLGSGRRLVDAPDLLRTYRPDPAVRPPLLLANLGAQQVRGPGGLDRARRLVELLDADGLSLHLNPIQEAVQPEGDTDFSGVIDAIAAVVARLAPLPVLVKEVGFGMDPADVVALRDAGVAAIDLAGSGGTNWALVEGLRDPRAARVAAAFGDWGVPTARALVDAREVVGPGFPLVASGGIRDGVEVAKCLALGARAAGLARPLLMAAQEDRVGEALEAVIEQLRIATWAAGAASSATLDTTALRAPASERTSA